MRSGGPFAQFELCNSIEDNEDRCRSGHKKIRICDRGERLNLEITPPQR